MTTLAQFSPSALHLLVPVPDSTQAQLWAKDSGACIALQQGTTTKQQAAVLTVLCWADGGSSIVAGTAAGTIVIWDAQSGAVRNRVMLKGKTTAPGVKGVAGLCASSTRVFAVAFGALFEVDIAGGTFEVLEVAIGREAAGYMVINSAENRLAISSDVRVLLLGIDVERNETPRKIARYRGHSTTPNAMTFIEETSLVTADPRLPTLMLWGESDEMVHQIPCSAVAVALSSRRRQIVSVHEDGSVGLWKVSHAEIHAIRSFIAGSSGVHTAAALVSKQIIVTVSLSDITPAFGTYDIENQQWETSPASKAKGVQQPQAVGAAPARQSGGTNSVIASTLPGRYEYNDADWEETAATSGLPPKTLSMTLVLRQALRTQDTQSLRKVIYNTDEEYVDVTVKAIPPSHAAFFLRQCTTEFQEPNARTDSTRIVLVWVRAVVRHHGTHIRCLPNAYALLAPLRGILGEFTRLTPQVSTFVGRLGVLCRQATEWEEACRSKGPPRFATQRFDLLRDGQIMRL